MIRVHRTWARGASAMAVPGVPRVGRLGGVHGEAPDDVDTELLEFGIGHGCQTRADPLTGSANREVSALLSGVHRRGRPRHKTVSLSRSVAILVRTIWRITHQAGSSS